MKNIPNRKLLVSNEASMVVFMSYSNERKSSTSMYMLHVEKI